MAGVGEENEVLDEEDTSSSHHWKVHTFKKPTFCSHCRKLLIGLIRQGYRCKACRLVTHNKCKGFFDPCTMVSEKSRRESVAVAADALPAFLPSTTTEMIKKGHSFYPKHFKRFTFCNLCRDFIAGAGKQGVCCEVCMFSAHNKCMQQAMTLPCKVSSGSAQIRDSANGHHWIEGGMLPEDKCSECGHQVWTPKLLAGFRCLWCDKVLHNECFRSCEAPCSYTPNPTLMLSPSILPGPPPQRDAPAQAGPEVRPVIMVVSSSTCNSATSGLAAVILRKLRRELNPRQVIDLSEADLATVLQELVSVLKSFRILVWGEDSDFFRVWEAVAAIYKPHDAQSAISRPGIALLPVSQQRCNLGRLLGWSCDLLTHVRTINKILSVAANSQATTLDEFRVACDNLPPVMLAVMAVASWTAAEPLNKLITLRCDDVDVPITDDVGTLCFVVDVSAVQNCTQVFPTALCGLKRQGVLDVIVLKGKKSYLGANKDLFKEKSGDKLVASSLLQASSFCVTPVTSQAVLAVQVDFRPIASVRSPLEAKHLGQLPVMWISDIDRLHI